MLANLNKPVGIGWFSSRWVQFAMVATILACTYDFVSRITPAATEKTKVVGQQLTSAQQRGAPYDAAALLARWPLQAPAADGDSASSETEQSAAVFTADGIKLRLMAVYAVSQQSNKIHALLSYQTADSQPQLLLLSPGQQVGPFTLKAVALNEATFIGADQTFTLYLFKALTREENHS